MKREECSKCMSVSVEGWFFPRDLLVKEGSALAFQITLGSNCCDRSSKERVEQVIKGVEASGLPYAIELIAWQLYLILPLAEGENPVEVFARATGLTVEWAHHYSS